MPPANDVNDSNLYTILSMRYQTVCSKHYALNSTHLFLFLQLSQIIGSRDRASKHNGQRRGMSKTVVLLNVRIAVSCLKLGTAAANLHLPSHKEAR